MTSGVNTYLSNHFNEEGHDLSHCSIQIIDSVHVNDSDNEEDCCVKRGHKGFLD